MKKVCVLLILDALFLRSQFSNAQNPFEQDKRESVLAFKDRLGSFYDAVQSKKPATTDDALTDNDIRSKVSSLYLGQAFPNGTSNAFVNALAQSSAIDLQLSALKQVTSQLVESRVDKQAAANTNDSGTTNLVSKSGASELLAFAIEAGALTRSVNGSAATISGNLEGITSSLLGLNAICLTEDECRSLWRKATGNIDVSASFSLAAQSTQTTSNTQPANGVAPPANTAVSIPSSSGKLSSLTAKYTIHNRFDPHSSTFRGAWQTAMRKHSDAISSSSRSLYQAEIKLDRGGELSDPFSQTAFTVARALFIEDAINQESTKLADDFDRYFTQAVQHARAVDKAFDANLVALSQTTTAFAALHKTVVDEARGNLFTAQYTYGKPVKQPETHTFSLVYGYAAKNALNDPSGLLSVNAGVSIYGGTIPSSAKYGRLHYGQVSAEFDRPFTIAGNANRTALSLAGYWQYQPSPSLLSITQSDVAPGTMIAAPTQVLVGTAGSLWVTQAKLTIKGPSSINIPVGVKWSNKSDLLGGNKVGAQVGISYDFSSLSTLFGSSN